MILMLRFLLLSAHSALAFAASPGNGHSSPTTESSARASAVNKTETLMQQLANAKVFSGAIAVQKTGTLVYAGGYGYAVEELSVPMKPEYIFPLGSQAKFFTTVAIHQLAKEGHLNISHPVAQYLDPADFPALQNRTWCPRVHGRESEGCQNVTVVDLLSMTSGILPSDMGACEDVPASAEWTPKEWYWQYRVTGANMTYGDATGTTGDYLEGTERLASLLNRLRILEMPLLFAPNEGWCYDDANYNVVGYLVEKFSNMSLGEYIQRNILTPANLTDTFYWNGAPGKEPGGLRKNMLPIPAYTTDFQGQRPPYSFQRTNRYHSWAGELSFEVGAAGAMFSTIADSLKWYMTFLVSPELLRLSKSEIMNMITPSSQPLRWANGTVNPSSKDASEFAQGMATHGSPGSAHGIEFTGGQWGFMVNTRIFQNDSDWARSDGVAVFVNSTPHIPKSSKCTVVSPRDNSTLTLPEALCGHINDESTELTDYISGELAAIWNFTSKELPASAAAVG